MKLKPIIIVQQSYPSSKHEIHKKVRTFKQLAQDYQTDPENTKRP